MSNDSVPGPIDPEQSVAHTPGSQSAQKPPSWGLTGQVVDASGRPLSNYLIHVLRRTPVDAPLGGPEIAIVSGPDGRFYYGLTPGRYLIQPIPWNQIPYPYERKSGTPVEVTLHPGQLETVTLVVPFTEPESEFAPRDLLSYVRWLRTSRE